MTQVALVQHPRLRRATHCAPTGWTTCLTYNSPPPQLTSTRHRACGLSRWGKRQRTTLVRTAHENDNTCNLGRLLHHVTTRCKTDLNCCEPAAVDASRVTPTYSPSRPLPRTRKCCRRCVDVVWIWCGLHRPRGAAIEPRASYLPRVLVFVCAHAALALPLAAVWQAGLVRAVSEVVVTCFKLLLGCWLPAAGSVACASPSCDSCLISHGLPGPSLTPGPQLACRTSSCSCACGYVVYERSNYRRDTPNTAATALFDRHR